MYNDTINHAQSIIDQVANPTMSHDEIENAINNIKHAINALDGEHKLQQAKRKCKENAINNIKHAINALDGEHKLQQAKRKCKLID